MEKKVVSFEKKVERLLELLEANDIPTSLREKLILFRALVNEREALAVSDEFLALEKEVLVEWRKNNKVMKFSETEETSYDNIKLWQGDITLLEVDAIVNAANSKMLGCFIPNHHCIDNQIHTFAGVSLRLACAELKKQNGDRDLAVGKAVITPAFNLPANYVIHTVGPKILRQPPSKMMQNLLEKSYISCLELAEQNNIKTLALCSISTGEFSFPKELASEIATKTVKNYLNTTKSKLQVVFVTYSNEDYNLYKKLL